MFGTSGHMTPPDGLVIENYTWRAAFPANAAARELVQYKSIVDPARITSVKNPHWFYTDGGRRAAYNEKRQRLDFVSERRPVRRQATSFD
jgi:hypothetical protein